METAMQAALIPFSAAVIMAAMALLLDPQCGHVLKRLVLSVWRWIKYQAETLGAISTGDTTILSTRWKDK
jgi:hypothetical protein